MVNFDRDRFDSMTTDEKISFVNNLVLQNIRLLPKEIDYLVPQNRDKYFYNRARTSEWLEDYEFNSLSDREKEIYIWNKRFLNKRNLKDLSPELQKQYIGKTISSGVQLEPEEFEDLYNDELRRYYVEEKIKYAIDTTFTPRELSFLNSKDQMQYINTLKRMGLAPNLDEIPVFHPEAKRYYHLQYLNEIRNIVRSEIKKILK
jgi:hypothetical protein